MLFYSICFLISFCRMNLILPIIWIIHCWSFVLLVSFCPYCFILFLLNVFNVLNAFDSKKILFLKGDSDPKHFSSFVFYFNISNKISFAPTSAIKSSRIPPHPFPSLFHSPPFIKFWSFEEHSWRTSWRRIRDLLVTSWFLRLTLSF